MMLNASEYWWKRGGRKDFAQAGGTNKDKIDKVFKAIADKIS